MSTEYGLLVDKVEAFTRATSERRRADMACRAGCDGCCQVWLSVSTVEADAIRGALAALAPEARSRVMERGVRERQRESDGASSPRCAMLESDGRCAVYDQRPLVCRTQGHALRYPQGFVPQGAVRARVASGDVTHCTLNFTHAAPNGEDVLDAERVDLLLALVNHRFAIERGQDPATRQDISDAATSNSGTAPALRGGASLL